MSDCLFCSIVEGDIAANIVYSDDDVVGFEDINAIAPIHVLFVPRKHISTLNDASDADEKILGHLMGAARRYAADQGFAQNGYRVMMNCNKDAGQTVFHIHLHCLAGRSLGWPPG